MRKILYHKKPRGTFGLLYQGSPLVFLFQLRASQKSWNRTPIIFIICLYRLLLLFFWFYCRGNHFFFLFFISIQNWNSIEYFILSHLFFITEESFFHVVFRKT